MQAFFLINELYFEIQIEKQRLLIFYFLTNNTRVYILSLFLERHLRVCGVHGVLQNPITEVTYRKTPRGKIILRFKKRIIE